MISHVIRITKCLIGRLKRKPPPTLTEVILPVLIRPAPPMPKIFDSLNPEYLITPNVTSKSLHVIAVYFNHNNFQNPRINFLRFQEHMKTLGVVLHVVELVIRDTPFQITDANNPLHTQLRTNSELFHKENLVNIGVKNLTKLYPDWKYVAWIDSDIHFVNSNIVADTVHTLNRYPVVQMWSNAIDLGPDHTPLVFTDNDAVVKSFAYCNLIHKAATYEYTTSTTWHPGYAWAMRRECWDAIDGLLDVSILGAGDHHMAWAFLERPWAGTHGNTTEGFQETCKAKLQKVADVVRSDLGCVNGLIYHYWHGRKSDRKYVERWSILVDNKYDPNVDLIRLPNGLLELTDRSSTLRAGIKEYFRQRNDDYNSL